VCAGVKPSVFPDKRLKLIRCSRADVPDYGLLNDLVWSDPSDTALEWEDNERGVSYCYGKAVINSFLATHVSLVVICVCNEASDQSRGAGGSPKCRIWT
jgi:diadenosine tetraphosphatase ApaH/serine/threonine PP2A family protein phosphatase